MKISNIEQFISDMEALGYRKGRSFHTNYKPEHSLWKSFHGGEEESDSKGYQICLGIWDNKKHDPNASINVSFDMKINHQSPIQVDRMDIYMMDDSMDVAEFERRCEALWNAMKVFMPRVKATTY